jgi:hypothetical protein
MTLTYVGAGAFLPGVPARNLTDEEVQMYGGREALLASGLYEEVAEQEFREQEFRQPAEKKVAEKEKANGRS